MKDIVFGVVAGLIGAIVWGVVTLVTQYEIGWIAWGIGGLVGYAVAYGNSDRGRAPVAAGVIAVVITALSIAGGKYAAVQLLMPSDAELVEMLTEGFDDEEYVMSFLADDVVREFQADDRTVAWPDGVDPLNAASAAEFPADVWSVTAERWGAMSESDRADFRTQREEESRTNIEENMPHIRAAIGAGGFFASFTPMDVIFFGLGMVTAWGIGSGRKSREEVARAYSGALVLSMLRVAGADGSVTDDEVEAIRSELTDVLGTEVDAATVRAQAESSEGGDSDLLAALEELAPHLENEQRETAVRCAVRVAMADGHIGPSEQQLVEEVAKALDVSDAHLRGILSHMAQVA